MPDNLLNTQGETTADDAGVPPAYLFRQRSRAVRPPEAGARTRDKRDDFFSLLLQFASLALLLGVVLAVSASMVAGRKPARRTTRAVGSITIVGGIDVATATSTTALIGPSIRPIPATCGPSLTAPPLGPPGVGNAVGADPVWVDGFDGTTATVDIPLHVTGPYSTHGWPVLIVLAFQHPFSATVALDGESLPTRKPLWFSFQGPNGGTPPSEGFTMDPHDQANLYPSGDSTAKFWFGTLFLPGAGCYALDARWNSSNWRVIFAAGR